MPLIQQTSKTRTAYAADWKAFTSWCRANSQTELPAAHATILTYCHALLTSGHKVATCQRHLSAINSYHRQGGHAAPATRETRQFLTAVKRLRGEQITQKRALTLAHIRGLAGTFGSTPIDARDRAVILLGFASALRRSTIVGLDVDDVENRPEGLVLTIRREKQDRKGDGRIVGVARGSSPETDPAEAVTAWLGIRGKAPGPLFTPLYHNHVVIRRLHPERVARIVKNAVVRLGLNPAEYGGHSLRAGLVTTALEAGVNEIVVATHTGHRSLATLRRYFRRADPFRANASSMIGL